jgi:hypothetical protein
MKAPTNHFERLAVFPLFLILCFTFPSYAKSEDFCAYKDALTVLEDIIKNNDMDQYQADKLLADDGTFVRRENIISKKDMLRIFNRKTSFFFPDYQSYIFLKTFISHVNNNCHDMDAKEGFVFKRKSIVYTFYFEPSENMGGTLVFTINFSVEKFVEDWGYAGTSYLYLFRYEDGVLHLRKINMAG